MSRQLDESGALWYERAIVLASEAEAAVGQMNDSPVIFNDRARFVIRKRADEAAADLSSARRAFVIERRQAGDEFRSPGSD